MDSKIKDKLNVSILYVEPEKEVMEPLSKVIGSITEELYLAKDASECLTLLKSHKPDIVITNIVLTNMKAVELYKEIKTVNHYAELIVVLSNGDINYLPEPINAGINNFLIKPFTDDRLLSVIERCADSVLLRKRFNKQNEFLKDIVNEVNACRENEDRLASEKEQYKKLLENAPFGIMLIDMGNNIKYINNRFTELFGYNQNDIPDGRTWFRLAYPDPTYRREIIATWLKDMESGETGRKDPWILTVTCKDRTHKTINFIPVRLDTGEFMVSCEDMGELKKHENKLLYMVNFDSLTGLPNRRSLEMAIRQAIDNAKKGKQRGSRSAIVFADVNDFHEINQNYGHTSGDEVLIALAKVLKNSLRTGDSAYRFGADEFVILLRGISMAEAKLAAERLQRTINQHVFVLDYTKYSMNISMGIVQIDGTMDITTLLSNAVQTIQKAKKLGRNVITVY